MRLQELIQGAGLTLAQRQRRQKIVYEFVVANSANIQQGDFDRIATADLGLLFQIIDEQFFEGQVGSCCEQIALKPLSFRLSTRMTTSGGMTTMTQMRTPGAAPEFEIAIATTPIFDTFKVDRHAKVGGITCHDRLQALQRIMEHEMIHLAELLLFRDSNCAAAPFKQFAYRFFGHTESNHRLLTPRDLARKKLGIQPGDNVLFSLEGRTLTGVVNRITKRATVLVSDPNGTRYSDGKRYAKYYVPLPLLKRAG